MKLNRNINPLGPCIVIYRGPLERSRIATILKALLRDEARVSFLWVYPGVFTARLNEIFSNFFSDFSGVEWQILNHRWTDIFRTRRTIKELTSVSVVSHLVLIGDSAALVFPRGVSKRITWFINGIPEERNLRWRWLANIVARAQWGLYQLAIRPDRIVTVSTRMSKHVRAFFPTAETFAVPTCVDRQVFSLKTTVPKRSGLFCYLGTGAPWQALDRLSLLWQEIAKQDESLLFRVISRDPRCRVLGAGIATNRIEFVQSDRFQDVAAFLNECEAGFLIREDNIVNRVSFPTKMAEYLASGCWVVVSDLDWDASDVIRRFECGYLVKEDTNFSQVAHDILQFRKVTKESLPSAVNQAAIELDEVIWSGKLADFLRKQK